VKLKFIPSAAALGPVSTQYCAEENSGPGAIALVPELDLPSAADLAALAGLPDEPEVSTPVTQTPVETPDTVAQTADLEASILAKDAEIATLTAKVTEQATAAAEAKTAADAALAEANATIEGLKPAVQNSVKHLGTALNKQIDVAALDGKSLAATYAEYSAAYKTVFKANKLTKNPGLVGKEGEQTNKPNITALNPATTAEDAMFALRSKSLS